MKLRSGVIAAILLAATSAQVLVAAAVDHAGNGPYADGWQAGDNGGSGFQPWSLAFSGEFFFNNIQIVPEAAASVLYAWAAAGLVGSMRRQKAIEFNDLAWSRRFHVWRMDWDESCIKLFIDNMLLNTIDLDRTVNRNNGRNPFRQPHYLILSLAVGGTNGGDPAKGEFPGRFEVDYVRVYARRLKNAPPEGHASSSPNRVRLAEGPSVHDRQLVSRIATTLS